jgi:hypothetical protein
MKLGYSQQIFEKYPNIKLHKYLSGGSQAVPCRCTDKHDEANSSFLQILQTRQQSATEKI